MVDKIEVAVAVVVVVVSVRRCSGSECATVAQNACVKAETKDCGMR